MSESAYLKNSVGPLLAKAVAETVLAQPSNPQEYLALYLLHVLQQEECRATAAAMKQKAEAQRQIWAKERALREKRAVDVIQRFFVQCRTSVRARRAEEETLWSKYQEAEEEAEELLDGEEATTTAEKTWDGADAEANPATSVNSGGADGEGDEGTIEEVAALVQERRRDFYKAQRFMRHIRKALIGTLKTELVDRREQVRVEQDKIHRMLDEAEEELREQDEAEVAAIAARGALPSSAATADLVKQVMIPRHEKISISMILYRVLRCWCYLFFDCTPKQTDTPAKVAALVKPFTFMQLLRAFNPVATYQRNKPLRLESEKAQDEEENGENDMVQESGGEPLSQPKPRQARRVSRILRVLMHDGEYICGVNPADYMDMEENEKTDSQSESGGRGAEVSSLVEAAARKHGVMLYALLRLLSTASAYRDTRDRWVNLLQQNGQEPPSSEELPEDDDGDPNNEEGLRNDDGEVDDAAVRHLLLTIGVDTDEALSKLWSGRDEVQVKKWRAMAAARRSREEEEENSELNEDGDEEGMDAE